MLVMGFLIFLSVGSVLWIGIWLAQKNTYALLSENAELAVKSTVRSVEQYLDSVEHKVRFTADRIERGEVDVTDHELLKSLFTGMLAGAAQIDQLMYIDSSQQAFYVRYRRRTEEIFSGIVDHAGDPVIQSKMQAIQPGPNWGEPVWEQSMRKTQLELITPVYRDNAMVGAVVALVPVRHISLFVTGEANLSMGNLFVLSGRDKVMGHPLMRKEEADYDRTPDLPELREFEDKVLKSFWDTEMRQALRRLDLPDEIQGHIQDIDGNRYVYLYQYLDGYGPEPLVVGAYFPRTVFGEEVQRLVLASVIGLIALLAALGAAVFIGRKIAAPIEDFSRAATQVRDLELAEVQPLRGSLFRELDQQSAAFNAMLQALRWFEQYVPNRVVAQLVKRGEAGQTMSDARDITVMFTDMVNFSSLSEGLSAHEVAELLNHHFSLIGACINEEHGTIDKYIGDSVMAFWGAPEEQPHRAERACRTALAIAAAIRADNRQRQQAGLQPIGVRIGIHSGEVTVGNIGAPQRINYTAIGDAVNVGVRLEQLGKEVNPPGTEVSVLISSETARQLGDDFQLEALGSFRLKGRDHPVEVFRLV